MKATDILTALEAKYPERLGWWAFREFQNVDLWLWNHWPSQNRRIAVEVKVSRSDFLRELKQPTKRLSAMRLSNQFYFAAPVGLILPMELPPEAGLFEVTEQGKVAVVVQAPHRASESPRWSFVDSLAHRLPATRPAKREAVAEEVDP